jgi:L-ascorbate metabolism protein UlaG (beta-lactamase superfamily)
MRMVDRNQSRLTVTWAGHASVLIELDGVRLLTDPALGERVGPLVRIAPGVGRELCDDLDAVLISHLHADHADVPSLRRLGGSTRVIAPPGAARWLARKGMGSAEELGPGETVSVGAVRVSATHAAHDGRRWPLGAAVAAIGFVAGGSQSCYFAGDTDLYPQMSELAGRIDLALLPVWGWGPNAGSGHLDPVRATAAARTIAPRVVVPIHWGTLARGWPFARPADPAWPVRRFRQLMEDEAPSVEVRVLAPGERTQLQRRSPEVESPQAGARER